MQDSDSEEENPSIITPYENWHPRTSKGQGTFNYMQIIDNALKDYEDVNLDEVEILQSNENPFQYLSHTYLNTSHRTLVPIGGNFQVVVPPMLTQAAYKLKSAEMMKTLQTLKINDPEEGQAFYDKYFGLVEARFGPGRTYEDVNHLRNALKRMNSQLTFEEYLAKNSKYWQSYFKSKDRATGPKVIVKKKKKKELTYINKRGKISI